jgi:hypothetical protein
MLSGVFDGDAVAGPIQRIHLFPSNGIRVAKIQESFNPETIKIFYSPPNEQISVFFDIPRHRFSCSSPKLSCDWHNGRALQFRIWDDWRLPRLVALGKPLDYPSKFSGGQPPDIFKDNVSDQILICGRANAVWGGADIGPLEDSGVIRLTLRGFFSGPPETASGPPQSNGGKGKNDGEERDNFLVELVKDMPNPNADAPNISDERAGKGGAVFFCGILLAGIVAYLIAGRK